MRYSIWSLCCLKCLRVYLCSLGPCVLLFAARLLHMFLSLPPGSSFPIILCVSVSVILSAIVIRSNWTELSLSVGKKKKNKDSFLHQGRNCEKQWADFYTSVCSEVHNRHYMKRKVGEANLRGLYWFGHPSDLCTHVYYCNMPGTSPFSEWFTVSVWASRWDALSFLHCLVTPSGLTHFSSFTVWDRLLLKTKPSVYLCPCVWVHGGRYFMTHSLIIWAIS